MKHQLKHGLSELDRELKRINSENPKIRRLAGEVEGAISQPDDLPHSFSHSLRHIADEFEIHHPQLTARIHQVLEALSNLGI